MNDPTALEALVGSLLVGGLVVFCFLFFGWHPQYQKAQSEVADAQLERGDYGGCLATSGRVFGALFVIAVLGIMLMVGADSVLDVLNAANGR